MENLFYVLPPSCESERKGLSNVLGQPAFLKDYEGLNRFDNLDELFDRNPRYDLPLRFLASPDLKNTCKNPQNSIIYSKSSKNREEPMTILIVLIIIAVIVLAVVSIYNKLVRLRNTVKSSWSD